MRILTPLVLILGLITVASTALTQAAYTGPQSVIVNTAKAANTADDDTQVVLTGNLAKSLGDEHYLFADASGEVKVEIDNSLFRNLEITDASLVELKGEVDKEWHGREVEIDSIRVVTSKG
ncbi:NirD/YgiW/YdeI family stress tolerance protein [Shewanella sp. JM162201]|uniref:NirD/YgiW/YdeI family stress tolerance protein n=1 Tax=Shewanella jiangmenensis TaxID=2837387 RepID=A0ABS5V815_9GAMM|nr:NirD/YgiW/YdeI family stress tolerance protein [Shewanella jiangmenensis]MBT1445153.1 NirD/YgiW/YdeI family stress tolerance protein [Shewanella jiangmenensis]